MSKAKYVFILVILLAACSTPPLLSPAPTPQAIYISFPPVLSPWGVKLSTCASSNPLIALYLRQYSPGNTKSGSNDIELSLGQPAQINSSSTLNQVGTEKIVVIINRHNEVSELSLTQLQAIMAGQTVNWGNGSGDPVQVWVFPPDDPIRSIFDRALGDPNRLATNAKLAPDLQAMLEAVSADENSIGYLTGTFLAEGDPSLANKVKPVQLDHSLEVELTQPVIAITHGEPTGLTRELLVCLQTTTP